MHLVPIPKDFSGHILDVGFGTGLWCNGIGDLYPGATVRGVDLSPSSNTWVPPNVDFELDDVEEEWTYMRKFDFIHCRSMAGSIRNWPKLVKQCFEGLNPDGWVQFADWDYTPFLPNGTADVRDNDVVRWHRKMMDTICSATGATAKPGPSLKEWVVGAGFKVVREATFHVPIGGWAKDPKLKEIGRYYYCSIDEGLEGISLRTFTRLAGMSPEEAYVINASFRQGLKNVQVYHKL